MKLLHCKKVNVSFCHVQNMSLLCKNFKYDLEEMKSGDIDEIGRYVFASCWTDKKEENIALWNMYAEKMRGIRI